MHVTVKVEMNEVKVKDWMTWGRYGITYRVIAGCKRAIDD